MVQLPALSIVSAMLAVIASQSFGFATVIDPLTTKLLSVNPSSVATTA